MKNIAFTAFLLGLLFAETVFAALSGPIPESSCTETPVRTALPQKKKSSSKDKEQFLTYYETHDFNHTPRYEETVAYCKMLADASRMIHYTSIGTSPEGREIPLLIVDKDGCTTPEEVRKNGKAVVLIEACIHAGEPDGKEAGLMLIRDLMLGKQDPGLLERTTLLFIPILNVDGHEQFSAYNRINQNGPAELGTRATKQRINMNRDFIKADTPEMRCWLRLFNAWMPELFIDVHVTNGADFQYVMTYSIECSGFMDPQLQQWSREKFENPLKTKMAEDGFPIFPYFSFRRYGDASRGVTTEVFPPQYSHGYAAVRNRIGLLLENHIFKPYKQRVDATYRLLVHALSFVNENSKELQEQIARADRNTASETFRSRPFALNYKNTFTDSIPDTFLGWETSLVTSDLSGGKQLIQHYDRPVSIPTWIYTSFEPTVSVQLPEAYILSPENLEAIEILDLHGVNYRRLSEPAEIEVETYRFTPESRWSRYPYEGRITLTPAYTVQTETVRYPAGSLLIEMNQPQARVIPFILEPDSPTSLVYWGFFNNYIRPASEFFISLRYMEVKGREMLAADPQLKAEFERKKASDPAFASDPNAILQFFMSRIRKNVEPDANLYPAGRIMQKISGIFPEPPAASPARNRQNTPPHRTF